MLDADLVVTVGARNGNGAVFNYNSVGAVGGLDGKLLITGERIFSVEITCNTDGDVRLDDIGAAGGCLSPKREKSDAGCQNQKAHKECYVSLSNVLQYM